MHAGNDANRADKENRDLQELCGALWRTRTAFARHRAGPFDLTPLGVACSTIDALEASQLQGRRELTSFVRVRRPTRTALTRVSGCSRDSDRRRMRRLLVRSSVRADERRLIREADLHLPGRL